MERGNTSVRKDSRQPPAEVPLGKTRHARQRRQGAIRTDIPVEPLAVMLMTTIFGLAVAQGASHREGLMPTREHVLALLTPGLRPASRP